MGANKKPLHYITFGLIYTFINYIFNWQFSAQKATRNATAYFNFSIAIMILLTQLT